MCNWCDIGYYVNRFTSLCIANTIDNCYWQFLHNFCYACNEVYTTTDGTACTTEPFMPVCDTYDTFYGSKVCRKCTADN